MYRLDHFEPIHASSPNLAAIHTPLSYKKNMTIYFFVWLNFGHKLVKFFYDRMRAKRFEPYSLVT